MPRTRPALPVVAAASAGLVVAALAAGALASVLDLRRQAPVAGDVQAGKAAAAVCGACHGPDGIAVAPNFPNLAGQSATYLYVQLKTFKGGQRNDPVMTAMAATLDDASMRDLAAYFASLPPKRADAATAASRGAALFAEGDPGRGIPACRGCHGIGARGLLPATRRGGSRPHPPWSTIPRLSGQSGAYLAKALRDFRDGARAGTSNAAIMHGVAATLRDEDIEALADFVDGH